MRFTPTRLTLLSLLMISMMMLMGGAAVAPALPLISAYFSDATDFAISLVITLPSLAVAITGMAIGALADRYGKVRVLLISLAVFTFGGAVSFLLDDLTIILAMRFVLGIGIGGLSACTTALIAEYYTGTARVRVLSYQAAAMGIGALVLESAGGGLASFGWREPFLIYLIGVPIIAMCALSMREPQSEIETVDAGGRANRKLIAACYAAIFMSQLIFFLVPTKLPTFLEDPETVGHIGTFAVGLFLGLSGLVNAFMALMHKRIVSRIRPFAIIGSGFTVMGVGLVALIFSPTVMTALIAMILAGICMGTITPAITNTLARESTASTSGKIMGGYSTFMNFGQFAISIVSVPILAYAVGGSITDLCGLMGAVSLIIAVLFFLYCAKDGGFRSTV